MDILDFRVWLALALACVLPWLPAGLPCPLCIAVGYQSCAERGCEKCSMNCCSKEHDRCCCLHVDECRCVEP